MKPKRIILVRHGQSAGNVDKRVYNKQPDYSVPLTDLGVKQAYDAGRELRLLLGDETVGIYTSPYYRTRGTTEQIVRHINPVFIREDLRLREHEWTGQLVDDDKLAWEAKGIEYGITFFRFPTGESVADVYNRICTFYLDLREEFKSKIYPKNLIIVGHGMTNRVLLTRILGLKVEEFELLKNPKNGQYFILDQNTRGEYKLSHTIETREKLKRLW